MPLVEVTHPIDAALDLPSLLQAKKRAKKGKMKIKASPTLFMAYHREGERAKQCSGESPLQAALMSLIPK
jgi:hypothetical protein